MRLRSPRLRYNGRWMTSSIPHAHPPRGGAGRVTVGPDLNQAAPQPGCRCRVTTPPVSPFSASRSTAGRSGRARSGAPFPGLPPRPPVPPANPSPGWATLTLASPGFPTPDNRRAGSSWARPAGTDMGAFWVVRELTPLPPDRWACSPPAWGGDSDIVMLSAARESPAVSPDKRAVSPLGPVGGSDTAVVRESPALPPDQRAGSPSAPEEEGWIRWRFGRSRGGVKIRRRLGRSRSHWSVF